MPSVPRAEAADAQTLDYVRRYGYAIIAVPDGAPSFAYTLGLSVTWDHPEILVSAPQPLGGQLLERAGDAVRRGLRCMPGTLVELLGPGRVPVQYCPLLPAHTAKLGHALRLLHRPDVPALQLVYPDAVGCGVSSVVSPGVPCACAATEAQALALVRAFIAEVRASYRQQGLAPLAPKTRCHMVDMDA